MFFVGAPFQPLFSYVELKLPAFLQLRASGSELRQQLTALARELADAREHSAVLQRTLAHVRS